MATPRMFNLLEDYPAPEAGAQMRTPSTVDHPVHYTSHPSGVECIQITEHMNFNVGNAIKYLWRCDQKGKHLEDLKKARWYIDREIQLRERVAVKQPERERAGKDKETAHAT